MTSPVQGLHHFTAMCGDAQHNVDFYATLLGQRMVKLTVNFDDPGTYHLYYGDEIGSPGTILTFFPWTHAEKGTRGNGETAAFAYSVKQGALEFWKGRLEALELEVHESVRFGAKILSFSDPDDFQVELVAEGEADVPHPWSAGPLEQGVRLRGFHSFTLWVEHIASVRTLLVSNLGFTELGTEPDPEGPRTRFRGSSSGVGLFVDVIERPGKARGRFGVGSVHHIALRTRDDAEQAEYRQRLEAQGYGVTPVLDRQYFHSIYFRDPSGVLFEIATDAPGFAVDEPVSELGKTLKLPPWLESRRETLESHLPPVNNPEYDLTVGGRARATRSPAFPQSSGQRVIGPHQGQPILSAGRGLSSARVAMVLVHGRGGSAQDILTLADQFSMSAFAYLAPQAANGTWYPQSFLMPLERNEPGLSSGLTVLDDLLRDLDRQGIPPEHVVLGGFSQGACLALEYAARHARRYGAVFAFSGGLIGPEGTPRDYSGSLEGTPVFLGCSDIDSHIPLERVEQSARVLENLGARVDQRIYPGLGHTIVPDEIEAVQNLMRDLSSSGF